MTDIKTAVRILLAPIWLLTTILRPACRLAAGIGIYVPMLGGGLLVFAGGIWYNLNNIAGKKDLPNMCRFFKRFGGIICNSSILIF